MSNTDKPLKLRKADEILEAICKEFQAEDFNVQSADLTPLIEATAGKKMTMDELRAAIAEYAPRPLFRTRDHKQLALIMLTTFSMAKASWRDVMAEAREAKANAKK